VGGLLIQLSALPLRSRRLGANLLLRINRPPRRRERSAAEPQPTERGRSASAVPPDVRRWLCLAGSASNFGLRPWFGLSPQTSAGNQLDQEMYTSVGCTDLLNGAKPEPGAQPEVRGATGEAEPSPHIRRRSRYEKSCAIKQELINLLPQRRRRADFSN
jgi:hypothetical protein